MTRRLVVAGLLLGFAGSGAAQDYVVTSGRLSDDDFYRLVACGAAPGGDCALPFVRWPAGSRRQVTIGLEAPPADYPRHLARAVSGALDRAIEEINGVGADLNLVRAPGKADASDVRVRMMSISDGETVTASGIPALEGATMGAAYVYVWWNVLGEITSAQILLADDVPKPELYPVLLEEMAQAMGFLTDIRNPAYDLSSVFAEDSNIVDRLGPQDRAALLRHYPALN